MNCMKCGRETPGEQVFCEVCLSDMEKYPVKPGTVVLLPRRRENPAVRKAPKRRSLSLEEQVKVLKKRTRVMTVALVICLILILVMAYPSVQYLREDHFKKGQNYSVITTSTTPSEAVGVEN